MSDGLPNRFEGVWGVWKGSVDGLIGGVWSKPVSDDMLAKFYLAYIVLFIHAADIHYYCSEIKLFLKIIFQKYCSFF